VRRSAFLVFTFTVIHNFRLGKSLQGRYIKVETPLTPKALQQSNEAETPVIAPLGCKTIFIKNLPYDISEDEIELQFRVYGKITNIRLAVWGHTKQLKGFGYIEYQSEKSAEVAVKKSGSIMIKDRIITCDFETGQPKGIYLRCRICKQS